MCEPITTAIALSTAISAVGSHVQGNVQKDAAKRAGGAQRTATDEAINTLDTTYNESKGYYEPWSKSGQESLDMYMKGLTGGTDTITESPIYKEKQAKLERDTAAALAATGKGRSGVGVTNYLQPGLLNLYDTESNNYFNRLSPMVQYGFSADQNLSNLTSNYGVNKGNLQVGKGAINADQIQGEANGQVASFMGPINAINQGANQFSTMQGYGNKTPSASSANPANMNYTLPGVNNSPLAYNSAINKPAPSRKYGDNQWLYTDY